MIKKKINKSINKTQWQFCFRFIDLRWLWMWMPTNKKPLDNIWTNWNDVIYCERKQMQLRQKTNGEYFFIVLMFSYHSGSFHGNGFKTSRKWSKSTPNFFFNSHKHIILLLLSSPFINMVIMLNGNFRLNSHDFYSLSSETMAYLTWLSYSFCFCSKFFALMFIKKPHFNLPKRKWLKLKFTVMV